MDHYTFYMLLDNYGSGLLCLLFNCTLKCRKKCACDFPAFKLLCGAEFDVAVLVYAKPCAILCALVENRCRIVDNMFQKSGRMLVVLWARLQFYIISCLDVFGD